MFKSEYIIDCLPDLEYCRSICQDSTLSFFDIYEQCLTVLKSSTNEHTENTEESYISAESALKRVEFVKDKLWEIINIGHWKEVNQNDRKQYALTTALAIVLKYRNNLITTETIIQLLHDLDYGFMLGYADKCNKSGEVYLDTIRKILSNKLMEIDETTDRTGKKVKRPKLSNNFRQRFDDVDKGITILPQPSIDSFKTKCFVTPVPSLLTHCMEHWPAIERWTDINYILSVAGSRIVPVEIGSQYTNNEWSQDMVELGDFFHRQMERSESNDRIEYLAQHNLFDQVPSLKNDICIPEYCCLGKSSEEPDIKAWIGPRGTVSPMHFDPKHNFLCQIVGTKKIILAAPDDTRNLYPHDTDMLCNTSQIDAENINFEKFPLASNVRFYEIVLYPGEILYIPLKWWHYVRSLEKSISISFWWD